MPRHRKPTDSISPGGAFANRARGGNAARASERGSAPHASRPEQVYVRLRDLIVQGQLAPGGRIVETDVANRLGVSRTPVREALQRLQREGYVLGSEHRQQSRLTVAPLTRADVHELLTIVGAIEGLAARSAAIRDAEDRRQLTAALHAANADFTRAARAVPLDHSRVYDADERFHRLIVEAGAGPRLLDLHEAVKPQAERYIRMYISLLVSDVGSSANEHGEIIDAIGAGTPDEAEQSVETNWRHAAERLSRVIEVAGERGRW